MPAILEIFDGNPNWWNSPDIWVVPGNDPAGSPGQPIAGQTAYLWGRVHNTGENNVTGAQVKFYWSNPATGVLRSNSTFIGSAFVDLSAGETKEVLCLIPWIPIVVNDGHECVVAEVIHSSDPLPTPLSDLFNPPMYHQIAQKNLNVVVVRKSAMRMFIIQLASPKRHAQQMTITLEIGGELDNQVLAQVGLPDFQPADTHFEAGLALTPECNGDGETGLGVEIAPGTAQPLYLKVWPPELDAGTYTLLNVIAQDGKNLIGGITYVFVSDSFEYEQKE